jgi:hypothetical protein
LPIAAPNAEDQLDPWWLEARSSLDRRNKNRFDAWVMLICWSIWNQRNARVFGNLNKQCNEEVLAEGFWRTWSFGAWRVLEFQILGVSCNCGFEVGVCWPDRYKKYGTSKHTLKKNMVKKCIAFLQLESPSNPEE